MPEPITTVGLSAIAAYLGKDGLEKLLGPTAEYLGNGIRDLAQRRVENIGRILQNANKKLGNKIDDPGEVPPRVLKAVLDEGSFCDDDVAAEYFGGVLASSRTEQGRDDRGARIAKILDSLSSYQIRSHYLIYSTIREHFSNSGLSLNMEGRPKMQIYLPLSGYLEAMEFDDAEFSQLNQIITHVFFGLHAENLIEGTWQLGPQKSIIKLYADASEDGIICQPSALGAELYLWAFGQADKPLDFIFESQFQPSIDNIPLIIAGSAGTKRKNYS